MNLYLDTHFYKENENWTRNFFLILQGYLCHPYLALQYFDLLQDVNVKGFVIGATNILFKQKHNLTDVIVEVRSIIQYIKNYIS